MKSKTYIGVLFCVVLLQGCAQSAGRWYKARYAPVYMNGLITNYKLNQEHTVYIGQEIIKVQTIAQQSDKPQEIIINDKIFAQATFGKSAPMMPLSQKVTLEVEPKTYQINNMLYFEDEDSTSTSAIISSENACNIQSSKMFYLLQANDKNYPYPWGILLRKDGVIHDKALFDYSYNLMWVPPILVVKPSMTKITIKPVIYDNTNNSYVTCGSYELLYSGRNEAQINITYREFSATDNTKPAFFQNISYEANAKQIRFKDFVVQIHEATNDKLVYTVINDGLPVK